MTLRSTSSFTHIRILNSHERISCLHHQTHLVHSLDRYLEVDEETLATIAGKQLYIINLVSQMLKNLFQTAKNSRSTPSLYSRND
jgi:hypothetical protein